MPDALEELGDRISAKSAGYMELAGAVKDADCEKVEVKGGVSSALGCCNKFEPQTDEVKKFSCGGCEYVTIK
jgi:hypothetical protein